MRKRHSTGTCGQIGIPDGEAITDFVARIDAVIYSLEDRRDERVLIVGHAHWIRLFTARSSGF